MLVKTILKASKNPPEGDHDTLLALSPIKKLLCAFHKVVRPVTSPVNGLVNITVSWYGPCLYQEEITFHMLRTEPTLNHWRKTEFFWQSINRIYILLLQLYYPLYCYQCSNWMLFPLKVSWPQSVLCQLLWENVAVFVKLFGGEAGSRVEMCEFSEMDHGFNVAALFCYVIYYSYGTICVHVFA